MKFYSIQKIKKDSTNISETFVIEPFEYGQALTFANSLRRILLSETYSYSITEVQINDIHNEFEQASFLREDTFELLLNLKQLILKPKLSFFKNLELKKIQSKILTKIKGPLIVTGGMLNIPKKLNILNPNQYICTIIDNSELRLGITFEYNKAYKLVENNKKEAFLEDVFDFEGTSLDVDTFFIPIKKVNYKIKAIRDTVGNLKESLIIEIVTNGTITPKRAFLQGLNSCIKLFYKPFCTILKTNYSNFFFNHKI